MATKPDRESSDSTLIAAMQILAVDIQSGDGVANAAIAEAAERLERLSNQHAELIAQRDALAAALTPVMLELGSKLTYTDESYNPDYHIEITVTVAEARTLRTALQLETSDA